MEKEKQFMMALNFVKNILIKYNNINNIIFKDIVIEKNIMKLIISINDENRCYYIDTFRKIKFVEKI